MIATIVVLKKKREREIATIMEWGSKSAKSTGQLGPRTIQLGLMGLIESHAGHPGPLYSVSAFFFLFETNSVKYFGLNLSLLFLLMTIEPCPWNPMSLILLSWTRKAWTRKSHAGHPC
jgi:hypothetical protein